MDSCFVLIRTHQYGIAPGQVSLTITDSAVYCQGECTSIPLNAWGYAMLMSPNEDETAVHGCHTAELVVCASCRVLVLCDVAVRRALCKYPALTGLREKKTHCYSLKHLFSSDIEIPTVNYEYHMVYPHLLLDLLYLIYPNRI